MELEVIRNHLGVPEYIYISFACCRVLHVHDVLPLELFDYQLSICGHKHHDIVRLLHGKYTKADTIYLYRKTRLIHNMFVVYEGFNAGPINIFGPIATFLNQE